jgi:hypothetical protein
MLGGVVFHAAHALTGVGGSGLDAFTTNGVYTAVELIAVGVCVSRPLSRRDDRWAWGLMAFGLLTWTGGDLVWTLWLDNLADPPSPSVADALYLAMYPAVYVAIMLLIRSRIRDAGAAQWLDGGIVGLALAAVGAGLIMPTILAASSGQIVKDAVNLAYPTGGFDAARVRGGGDVTVGVATEPDVDPTRSGNGDQRDRRPGVRL